MTKNISECPKCGISRQALIECMYSDVYENKVTAVIVTDNCDVCDEFANKVWTAVERAKDYEHRQWNQGNRKNTIPEAA